MRLRWTASSTLRAREGDIIHRLCLCLRAGYLYSTSAPENGRRRPPLRRRGGGVNAPTQTKLQERRLACADARNGGDIQKWQETGVYSLEIWCNNKDSNYKNNSNSSSNNKDSTTTTNNNTNNDSNETTTTTSPTNSNETTTTTTTPTNSNRTTLPIPQGVSWESDPPGETHSAINVSSDGALRQISHSTKGRGTDLLLIANCRVHLPPRRLMQCLLNTTLSAETEATFLNEAERRSLFRQVYPRDHHNKPGL